MKTILAAILSVLVLIGAAEAKITRYPSGNPADVKAKLHGPALDLAGGSTDIDAAIQWMIDEARGCTNCATRIDVVVLRASGADGYNESILAMNGVDSVESIVVSSRDDSFDKDLIATVTNAEAIFFAGGDQCNYTTFFKGTPIETAVESIYKRGGAVGGTSAGLAIQGEFVFDACKDTARSVDLLANPYHETASFTYDFFNWKYMNGVLTDTHFQQRDRLGRLLAFLARQIRDGKTKRALGLAVNEKTSVVVDKKGVATVMGNDAAFFILADHAPEVCEQNKPLGYRGYKIWKRKAGERFDLRNRPNKGFYEVSVENGVISADPYLMK